MRSSASPVRSSGSKSSSSWACPMGWSPRASSYAGDWQSRSADTAPRCSSASTIATPSGPSAGTTSITGQSDDHFSTRRGTPANPWVFTDLGVQAWDGVRWAAFGGFPGSDPRRGRDRAHRRRCRFARSTQGLPGPPGWRHGRCPHLPAPERPNRPVTASASNWRRDSNSSTSEAHAPDEGRRPSRSTAAPTNCAL